MNATITSEMVAKDFTVDWGLALEAGFNMKNIHRWTKIGDNLFAIGFLMIEAIDDYEEMQEIKNEIMFLRDIASQHALRCVRES